MTKTTIVTGLAEWVAPGGKRLTAPIGPALLGEELFHAERVREGHQYQRQSNYHNWYAVAATGSQVWCESLEERAAAALLDFAGDIIAIATQPVCFHLGDRPRYPDMLVLHRDGTQTLIDVKVKARVTDHVLAQFEATAEACERIGWAYRVRTELPAQKRVNLEFLANFRHPVYAPSPELTHEVAPKFVPGWTFADLVRAMPGANKAEARARALGFLWSRTLKFDLGERLSNDTVLDVPVTYGIEAVDAV